MRIFGPALLVILFVGAIALEVGTQIYALQSPEHFLAMKRAEWCAAGIAVALCVVVGLALWAWSSLQELVRRWRHKNR